MASGTSEVHAVTVNIQEAFESCKRLLKAKLVPYITGSPGMGKSAIAKMLADYFELFLVDVRLTTCEPTDWNGLPTIKKDGRASYAAFDTIPLEGDSIPTNPKTGKPYRGFLVFFDELPSAPRAVIASAYKVLLDKMVGPRHIHKRCLMMAAGNLNTDNAIVNNIGTAVQSRVITLLLRNDARELIDHAISAGWDQRVITFLAFKPQLVNNFKPDHSDLTYACQRTWEFMSNQCKQLKEITYDLLPDFAGTVGTGVAHEFIAFCEYSLKVPTENQIMTDPLGCSLSDEPGIRYAAAGMVSEMMNDSNADKYMQFLGRLDIDMQVIAIRGAIRRHRDIKQNTTVRKWMRENYNEFID